MGAGFADALATATLVLLALVTQAPAQAESPLITPFPASGDMLPAPWHLAGLPHQKKPFTRFSLVDIDGRRALRVQADESYGNLVHPLVLAQPAVHLAWAFGLNVLYLALMVGWFQFTFAVCKEKGLLVRVGE